MSEAYFKNVKGIGNLYLLESYFKYACTDAVFSCKDAKDGLYFCVLVGLGSDIEEWCVFRTNLSLLGEFIHGRVTPWYMAMCGDGIVYEITETTNRIDSVEVGVGNSRLSVSSIANRLLPC